MSAAGPLPLEELVARARQRSAERRRRQPLERLRRLVREDPYRRERLLNALTRDELALIAPCLRGPSPAPAPGRARPDRGDAAPGAITRAEEHDFFERSDAYARAGAAALAVVTEGELARGRLEDLRTVEHTGLPRVRVDLVVDEGLVLESGVYGADALTLWPLLLEDGPLRALREIAREAGFAVCAVVHDERELERALPLEPELVVARGRDPRTLAREPERIARVLGALPSGRGAPLPAASGGLAGASDLALARESGARAVFLGASLARERDPGRTLSAWREGAR